jgi:RNA polymerase sigma-70 factor (ECF subfamily)
MPPRIYRLFDYLFQRHGTELLAFAGRRSGSDCAEDLVQEAYLRLLQHPNPESIANLRAFLFQTTANLTVDHHRKQVLKSRYHKETGTEEDGEGELEQAPVGDPAPDVYWSRHEELDRLNDMLQELPETTRYAFVLRRIEGLSHSEIAERLGISVRGSERHVAAALRHLLKHKSFG